MNEHDVPEDAEDEQETKIIEEEVSTEEVHLEGEEKGWSPVARCSVLLGCGLFVVGLICTPTMGARRSARLEWRQRSAEIEAAICAEEDAQEQVSAKAGEPR